MSKYQEALDTIRNDFEEMAVKPNDIGRFFKHTDADGILQELVDKEAPKEVKGISLTFEGRVGNCPTCNLYITEKENKKRCPNCGQHLDWSKE